MHLNFGIYSMLLESSKTLNFFCSVNYKSNQLKLLWLPLFVQEDLDQRNLFIQSIFLFTYSPQGISYKVMYSTCILVNLNQNQYLTENPENSFYKDGHILLLTSLKKD